MLDFLIIGILIFCMIYYLVLIETNPESKIQPKQLEQLQEIKDKFDPVYVYFKSIPEQNDYIFKHNKLTERKKPDRKLYTHSNKQMYFSLNKILRHFCLTDDFNKKEIMTLTYIPDNFDFSAYVNNYKSILNSDTLKLNEIMPNDLAKVMFELDKNINEMNENEIKQSQITYKKNKITLKTHDNFFMNIKYSQFPKEEYEVCAMNDNIVESVIKLRKIPLELAKRQPLPIKSKKEKKKYVYYIKFMNDHYLCINKDMILYTSKDKNYIFYFDVCRLTTNEMNEINKMNSNNYN